MDCDDRLDGAGGGGGEGSGRLSCNGKPGGAGEGRPGWVSRDSPAADWIDRGSAVIGWLDGGGKCCKDGMDWAGGSRMSLGQNGLGGQVRLLK